MERSESRNSPVPETAPENGAGTRREFLGRAAAVTAAVVGAPALLGACESAPTAAEGAARTAAPEQPRASLAGGPNPGVTLHKMMVATLGTAVDIKIPALEKGSSTTYLQRVVTDSDRTGTGLATVLKGVHKFASGTTVQVVVQDSRGRAWPARAVSKQADLVYAMKDALASNPSVDGVLRDSLEPGKPVVAISKSHLIQFHDSVASDFYGNHLDIFSRGMCDIFSPQVSGFKIASTTRDFSQC